MRIGFIGAGKVGFSLGKFFAQGGVPVTGYYSRRRDSAEEAAHFTNTTAFQDIPSLVAACDALFLTVPDGSITQVYRQLPRDMLNSKWICHCSGALSAREAFPGIEETGARGFSVHPLFPVSSKYEAYKELADAFFCVEGDPEGLELVSRLLRGLGCQVQEISAESKVRYHAACVFASNLVCALAQESIDLLEGCGFSRQGALAALAPLMRSNLNHLCQVGPVKALTGPVERCDVSTVAKHLDCFPTPEERELYRLLSRKLVSVALERHPDQQQTYLTMKEVLRD